jgi:hypothetical protein
MVAPLAEGLVASSGISGITRGTHTAQRNARAHTHREGDLFIYLFSYTYKRVRVRERLEKGRVCVSHTP